MIKALRFDLSIRASKSFTLFIAAGRFIDIKNIGLSASNKSSIISSSTVNNWAESSEEKTTGVSSE